MKRRWLSILAKREQSKDECWLSEKRYQISNISKFLSHTQVPCFSVEVDMVELDGKAPHDLSTASPISSSEIDSTHDEVYQQLSWMNLENMCKVSLCERQTTDKEAVLVKQADGSATSYFSCSSSSSSDASYPEVMCCQCVSNLNRKHWSIQFLP